MQPYNNDQVDYSYLKKKCWLSEKRKKYHRFFLTKKN